MTWCLYLDDERYPSTDRPWKLARNTNDAMWYVRTYGIPDIMSLDHDLGANKSTGYDFVKDFCSHWLDLGIFVFPKVMIHSANPVGAKNMEMYIKNFKDHYGISDS